MWNIQPTEFWGMAPAEWWLLYDAHIGGPKWGGMDEQTVDELYRMIS